jgi:metallo-beta-lactamase class B
VFLASHGMFFNMAAKRAALLAGKPDAFVDPVGCKSYFAKTHADFEVTLAKQRADAIH